MNVACNPSSLLKLENNPLRYLGKISYGIYMFHYTAILFVAAGLGRFATRAHPVLWGAVFYVLVFALTILLAAVSYRYFESFFLNLKSKFAIVKSAD